jgi:hypothetical protein
LTDGVRHVDVLAGPAERQVRALLRKYAAEAKAVVVVACLLLGTLEAPGPAAVAAMLALAGWTALIAPRLSRAPRPWLLAADIALLTLAALTQQWTVPDRASADSTGWILAALTVTSVTLQWCTGATAGAAGVAAFAGAYAAGAYWAVGGAETGRLSMLLWLIPQAALSRLAAWFLLAAARQADALAAVRESERVAAAVNAARRADERRHQALLHDTVAATLLMVGVGAVPERSGWLAAQAARDLRVLQGPAPAAPANLADLLRAAIADSPVRIEHGPFPAIRLPAPIAQAIAGAVHEALTNVRRHAGVPVAHLSVKLDPVRVIIADAGRGFVPGAGEQDHRRGVAHSIVGRLADAGGRASIASAPGAGTVVTLEWTDG